MNKLEQSLKIMEKILSTKTKEEIDKELLELNDGLDCGPTFSEFFNVEKSVSIEFKQELTYLSEDCLLDTPVNNKWYYPTCKVYVA